MGELADWLLALEAFELPVEPSELAVEPVDRAPDEVAFETPPVARELFALRVADGAAQSVQTQPPKHVQPSDDVLVELAEFSGCFAGGRVALKDSY